MAVDCAFQAEFIQNIQEYSFGENICRTRGRKKTMEAEAEAEALEESQVESMNLGLNLNSEEELSDCVTANVGNTNTISLLYLVNSNEINPAVKISTTRFRPIQPQPTTGNVENQQTVTIVQSTTDVNSTGKTFLRSEDAVTNETGNISNQTIHVEQVQIAGYFCNLCNCFYQCSTHCPAHTEPEEIILDSPIPSRARLTLPEQLSLQSSNVSPGVTGIFCRSAINKKTQFGPLLGKTLSKEEVDKVDVSDNPELWKVFQDGHLSHGLSVENEDDCNWLKFVQRARTSVEQNLVAFTLDSRVFFMSTRPIEADAELLFWFSTDFSQALGLPTKPEEGFTCTECGKQFVSGVSLERHRRYLHASTTGRKWECPTCHKFFSSATKLGVHTLGHLGIKPHACNFCKKTFTDASNLRGHLTIHTGERRFSCSLCPKNFRQKAHLASHLLTHSGEKKHKCRYCERWFARTSDARQHEWTHTCERQFECPICKKVFYRRQTHKKHLKVHLGQRDFDCKECKKKFLTKYHLNRHLNACHGGSNGGNGEDGDGKES